MVLGQFECGRVWEALSSHTPASRKGLCPLSYPLNPFDQQSQAHGGDLSHQSLCTCTGDPGSFSYELWLLVNSLCPPHPLRGTYVTNFTKKKKKGYIGSRVMEKDSMDSVPEVYGLAVPSWRRRQLLGTCLRAWSLSQQGAEHQWREAVLPADISLYL